MLIMYWTLDILVLPNEVHLHGMPCWTDAGTEGAGHSRAVHMAGLYVVHHSLALLGVVLTPVTQPGAIRVS